MARRFAGAEGVKASSGMAEPRASRFRIASTHRTSSTRLARVRSTLAQSRPGSPAESPRRCYVERSSAGDKERAGASATAPAPHTPYLCESLILNEEPVVANDRGGLRMDDLALMSQHGGRVQLTALLLAVTASFVFSSYAIATPIAIQDTCIPPAVGVPGLPGPPIWWDASMNGRFDDPRWNGAVSHTAGISSAEYVDFRAVHSGGKLYLSWEVRF